MASTCRSRVAPHGACLPQRSPPCRWWSSDRLPWTASKRPRRSATTCWAARPSSSPTRPATSRPCGWSAWWATTGPPSTPGCSRRRNIDTAGLQVVPGGKTFRWRGRYLQNMNDRETLDVQLNVMGQFDPVLPEHYRRCQFLFLANGSPVLQMKVLDQCPGAGAGRGRHHGPLDPRRAARSCWSCSSGSTAWCSTTARPSC